MKVTLGILPGLFVSRQVFLLTMLLADAVSMRGSVVQFGSPLVVLVM